MRIGTAIGLAATVAGLALGGAARAADLPAYADASAVDAPVGAPMTFGSGWYLRGDASFGPEDKPVLALGSGAAAVRDATPIGYGLGLGAGYKLTQFLRFDVTGDYLDPFDTTVAASCGPACSVVGHSAFQRFDGLANGYVDLGTWWGLSPYVGAGLGLGGTSAHGRFTSASPTAVTTTVVPEGTDLRFAWAAMAGLTYPVADHMLLDVGYRYLDLGKTPVLLMPGLVASHDLSAQEVRVGVRYMVE